MFDSEIVIVDDDPRILDKVVNDLSEANLDYNIHKALNGQEAIILIRRLKKIGKTIKLIITDFEMPIMNGLELLGEVKGSPTLKHIPVLMLTSVNDKARVISAIQKGVTNYCVKPWTKDDLIEKVHFCIKKGEAEA
jgi:two-component system chemotaxis response regulator CheY